MVTRTTAYALTLVTLLSACGSAKEPEHPKQASAPPPAEPVEKEEPPPPPKPEPIRVAGPMQPSLIKQVVRDNYDSIIACYETGLSKNGDLQGIVKATFVIAPSGAVEDVRDGGSDLPDPNVVACVLRAFGKLHFPAPESGMVLVTYPIALSPG